MKSSVTATPQGNLKLVAAGGRLVMCDWENSDADRAAVRNRILRHVALIPQDMQVRSSDENDDEILLLAEEQLREYLNGNRKTFDVLLSPYGTDFQLRVWEELSRIPYGCRISYAELAERIGNPKGVRAVASACRANALSIFIPCHRVIASDGSEGGYAGGKEAKAALLSLEEAIPPGRSRFGE